jgi:prophage antirepressor-like protein
MSPESEYFRFWVVDEVTGNLRHTSYKMTREQAAERCPGAEPDLATREVRQQLPHRGQTVRRRRATGSPPKT